VTTLDPAEYTIDELEDRIEEIESQENLQSILGAERAVEDRKGAKEAIEDRLDDLEDEGADDTEDEADGGTADLVDVRNRAGEVAEKLVGSPLDAVTGVERDGDEWHAVVDVVERSAVPDTQDILGRYEIRFDDDASVVGYRRRTRFRRSDTTDEL
jgi:hypothetical protein